MGYKSGLFLQHFNTHKQQLRAHMHMQEMLVPRSHVRLMEGGEVREVAGHPGYQEGTAVSTQAAGPRRIL